jgi:tetratricopeptide (TPR) repeat protein
LIDREASGEAFMSAYGFFLQNRLWNCLDSLDEALRQNTYFVDVYYLRSLALRRLGRYKEAIGAMTSYLEVRQDDYRAQIILDSMKGQFALLRRTLYPNEIMNSLFLERLTTGAFLKIPIYDKESYSGMRGLGKISAAGDFVFVCDTLGNSLLVAGRNGRSGMTRLDVEAPVAAVPLAPSEALLFQKSGDVKRLSMDSRSWSLSATPVGSLDVNVSDAALIDSTLFVIADRTGQSLRFYSLPSLAEVTSWSPPESEETRKLFEPVAAASHGPFTAVADRGNGRVYVLDSFTLAVQDMFEAELPRDVEWGSQGELFVVSESGRLYRRFPTALSDTGPELVADGMNNAWSVSWMNGGLIISDISARMWWKGGASPKGDGALGALTLHSPWIEEKAGNGEQRLMLRGAASSAFLDFMRGKAPDIQVVWRNEVRPSRVTEVSADKTGAIFYYSPNPSENIVNDDVRRASSISDVIADIAAASRGGRALPKALVLDTRISGTNDELETFFGFLLQHSVRLDLWAVKRPPSALVMRISQMTMGNSYYSASLDNIPLGDGEEWMLSVPLPPETATYGYPSDATMSVFATVDVIRMTDWIPLWPSLLSREPVSGGVNEVMN